MDEQLRKPEDEQNTNQDDSYSFMNETVKKRPLPVGKYLIRALEIIASACLFGLVAGLVFMHVTARNDKTVTITSDEEPVSLETAASESAAESAATVTPTPVPQPMTAEEKQQQTLDDYEQQNRAVYAVAETAMQSVVGVTGYSDATGWLSGNDPTSSSVSGLLVASTDSSMLVLVDYRSLSSAATLMVTFADGTVTNGTLVREDPTTELAVLSVPTSSLSASTLASCTAASLGNSYNVTAGDGVIAIGSPMGYSNSVAYGEITSTDNLVSVTDGEFSLLTTDMQGSTSGTGVLVNLDGQVVGFVMQKYAASGTSTVTGVAISYLKSLIETLSNNEAISYMGIRGQDVSASLSGSTGVPEGVYVNSVDAGSPALAAGLAAGDVITDMDGTDITTMRALHNRLVNLKPGDEVTVTVRRKGTDGYKKFEFTITLGELK
ncbi:MAG: S1C family serine protease [Eubacteriales bacterium]|jgi:S1-C subfamily serine protease|nr:S1C family serine protease [Lachnospiraceae bacterium]MDD5860277.1 S1C family serine protease [Eubacteriales bacterium]MCH4063944.1 S1C family serine protease [Lachnospiraceae bacterium]MCH4103334.1 S1C family serine protease [Lachnospiraceae bacterium]MCI1309283.1 S1C family serine protease [Lachnospiraceae bacterium]